MSDKLIELIREFQSFGERTGRSKSSSYYVDICFSPLCGDVLIKVGGYDIGDWNRHTDFKAPMDEYLELMESIVSKADKETEDDHYCEKCGDYHGEEHIDWSGWGK